jgi:CHAT domain-containing protein/tetratricopeptide (TPR) repeat protein
MKRGISALALLAVLLAVLLAGLPAGQSRGDPAGKQGKPAAKLSAVELASLEREASEQARLGDQEKAADLYEDLANELEKQRNFRGAILHFGNALELRRFTGNFDKLSLDLNRRGLLFSYEGKKEKARADYTAALKAATRGGNRQRQASSVNNLGLLMKTEGNFAGARDAFETALSRLDGVAGVVDTRARISRNLAQLYWIEGSLTEAELLLAKFRELDAPEEMGAQRGGVLADLGLIEQIRKQPAKALAYYLEALEFVDIMPYQDKVVFWDQLASTLLSLGRQQEAWQSYHHALELARDTYFEFGILTNLCKLSVLHPELGPSDEGESCDLAKAADSPFRDHTGRGAFFFWFARHLEQQGRLQEAIAADAEALRLIDSLRSGIPGRNNRSRFLEGRSFIFPAMVELLMKAHDLEPASGYDLRALEISERSRARSVLELWAEAGVDLWASANPALREARDRKLAELDLLESLPQETADQIRRLLVDLDVLDQKLRESSPYYRRVVRPPPVDIAAIQRSLDEETAILMLVLGAQQSRLFILDHRQVRSFKLVPGPEIEEAAAKFLGLLADPEAVSHRAALWTAGARLAALLWGENEERLDRLPTRLVFLGDGNLQELPISALPRLGSSPEQPRYLIESFEVVNLPALALLDPRTQPLAGKPPSRGAILLGDPFYQLRDRSDIRLLPLGKTELERHFPGGAAVPLGRLPFADLETALVAARFPTGVIEVARGTKASKKLALSATIADYSIVHLTSHGWRDPDHAELSTLLLAEVDEKGTPVDGKLRLQDLYGLRLRADLVVASACQTGIGGNFREGVSGLAQGFFQAGARRTLVSLWQVESRSTAHLMDRFYAHLLAGEPPGTALRQASLDLMKMAREQRTAWDSPFFWSPFVLIGDWTSFKLPGGGLEAEHSH